jgi:hypothetical protein
LVEHDEVDAAGLELLGDLNQVLERAAEPVELGDDESWSPCRLAAAKAFSSSGRRASLPEALSMKS